MTEQGNALVAYRLQRSREALQLVDPQLLPGWLAQAQEFLEAIAKLVPGAA